MILHPQIETFLAILEEGSFEEAARRLSITPSAVSQRLRHLEDRLGTTLIVRSSPPVPTPHGERLLARVRPMHLLAEETLRNFLPDSPDTVPRLAIVTPADVLATWLMPALADFQAAHDVRLEILTDDQDHSLDLLRRGLVSGAITSDASPVQGARVRALGCLRYRAVASKDFLARHFPAGLTEEALRTAPVVAFNRKDALQHRFAKQLFGDHFVLPDAHLHYFPSVQSALEAARRGFGWAMAVDTLLAEDEPLLAPDAWLDVPLYWQVSAVRSMLMEDLTRTFLAHAHRLVPMRDEKDGEKTRGKKA